MAKKGKKPRKRRVKGTSFEGDGDWGPLENVIPYDVCDDFMYMFAVKLEDGTILHAYKHYWNRRYLHLSAKGEAFTYVWQGDDFDKDEPSEYEQVQLQRALIMVLGYPSWPAVEERMRSERQITEGRAAAENGGLNNGEPYSEEIPF